MDNKKVLPNNSNEKQNTGDTIKQDPVISSEEDYLKTVEATLDEWNSAHDEKDYRNL